MARTSTKMQFCSASDVGQIRTSNQDFLGNKEEASLFIVADGMGGHAGGERASRLAVDTALENYRFSEGKQPNVKTIKELLIQSIQAGNRAIHDEASQNRDLQQMGTTIVAVVLHGPYAILAHVGDSRIYRLRGSQMEQVTVDHSFVQEQIDAGIITEEDSKNHRMKNVITRALGVDSNVEVDIKTVRVREGDIFLLCTDGLHGMASDLEIKQLILSEPDLDKSCQALIDLANANGGKDNVTATLVRVGKVAGAGLPSRTKLIGASAVVAGIILLLYLLSSLFTGEKEPTQVTGTQAGLPEIQSTDSVITPPAISSAPGSAAEKKILELRNAAGNTELSVDERASKMLALAITQLENGNVEDARAVAQEFLALCIINGCDLRIPDIEDPQLKEIITTSLGVQWTERFQAMNQKMQELPQDDMKKYAPAEFDKAISMVSLAEMAYENNQLFLALTRLDDANDQIDETISASNKGKLTRKQKAEKALAGARRTLTKIDVPGGPMYKDMGDKLKSEKARLKEAERKLNTEDYDGSMKLAGNITAEGKKLLAKAQETRKEMQATEEIAGKVAKKWTYITSDEFEKLVPLMPQGARTRLAADHERFQSLVKAGDHKKAPTLGNEILSKADILIQDTSTAVRDRIAEAEIVLAEKEMSGKEYDEAELARGTSILDEAKLLANMQFLSKAYEKVESLEQLIDQLDKKEPPKPPPAESTTEPAKPARKKPSLSAPELQMLARASEQAGILETYLQQTAKYVAQGKMNHADDYLGKYLPEKFTELASHIPANQKALRDQLKEARRLCLKETTVPSAADVERSLEQVRSLKKELDRIIATNKTDR